MTTHYGLITVTVVFLAVYAQCYIGTSTVLLSLKISAVII